MDLRSMQSKGAMTLRREAIRIQGRVQGVGFRPAVHRLAAALGLTGLVRNDSQGVAIEIQGPPEKLAQFMPRLNGPDRPALARISSFEQRQIERVPGEDRFVIVASQTAGSPTSHVTPDVATCRQCLSELRDQTDLRYRYPFINCTQCGPRYTIVRQIPYDRSNTTMSAFAMCHWCAGQYSDVQDRRFHAEPVACPVCGPRVWLADPKGQPVEADTQEAIARAARMLSNGAIVAIKGIGGFHLAVDAFNGEAVRRLRSRKRRDSKPFAMMAASVDEIRRHAEVDACSEALLTGPESPIVLVPKGKSPCIAEPVAEGTSTLGFMLCYAPLHHLLFEQGPSVLVATSGNISDEPLICDNDAALERLGSVADAFLMHDRQIYRQVDDSVLHMVDGQPALLRRARGYVPSPILMDSPCSQDVLAMGPDLKNTFCLVKGRQLICSEHVGDLDQAEVFQHYVRSIGHLAGLFEVKPQVIACDLHPGYVSTQYARSLAGSSLRIVEVQHHWAHVAAVLAECQMEGPVIGLVADGTGYGTDGAIWGCECLIASLDRFDRFGHLEYYPLAGADRAAKEPIRPLLALLCQAFGDPFELGRFQWLLARIEPDLGRQQGLVRQLDKGVNVVATSSLGRVFDAVAAMVGLGRYNDFDAQLPIALEAVAAADVDDPYPFELKTSDGQPSRLDLRAAIRTLVSDVEQGVPAATISARFHNTVVHGLMEMARLARDMTGLETVAVSGGVMCNRYVANRLIRGLKAAGFQVLSNRDVPANDGGISLGQAAIAAYRANRGR
jgi:hydrogenase maturation protein HypF